MNTSNTHGYELTIPNIKELDFFLNVNFVDYEVRLFWNSIQEFSANIFSIPTKPHKLLLRRKYYLRYNNNNGGEGRLDAKIVMVWPNGSIEILQQFNINECTPKVIEIPFMLKPL